MIKSLPFILFMKSFLKAFFKGDSLETFISILNVFFQCSWKNKERCNLFMKIAFCGFEIQNSWWSQCLLSLNNSFSYENICETFVRLIPHIFMKILCFPFRVLRIFNGVSAIFRIFSFVEVVHFVYNWCLC